MKVLRVTLIILVSVGVISCGRIWGTVSSPSSTCISSYPAQVLSDNPIGYWRLNETSGTTAYDLGSGGQNATYSANVVLGQPPAFPGYGNYAAYLSISSYVAQITGYTLSPPATNTHTVEFWTRASAPGFDMEFVNQNAGFTKGFDYDLNDVAQCAVQKINLVKDGVTGGPNCTAAAGWPNDSNWHHVAIVASNAGVVVYVDTIPTASIPDNSAYITCDATCTFQMGNNGGPSWIQDVAVYNSPLSIARIQAHYIAASSCH